MKKWSCFKGTTRASRRGPGSSSQPGRLPAASPGASGGPGAPGALAAHVAAALHTAGGGRGAALQRDQRCKDKYCFIFIYLANLIILFFMYLYMRYLTWFFIIII